MAQDITFILKARSEARRAAKEFADDLKKSGTNAKKLKEEARKAAKETDKLADEADRVRRNTDKTVKSAKALRFALRGIAAIVAGIGIGAVFSESTRLALDFNAALAETSTLIEGTPEQMAAIRSEAADLVSVYGGNATEQVNSFYQAISAGADGVAGAAEIVDAANKLAIGGITDVTTGVDVLTTAVNAYGPEVLSASDASDSLFTAMKAGKTTIGELSSSIGQVIPIAAAANVSFDEMNATIAALTTRGVSTNMAVTGLRGILAAVIKPTAEARKEAKRLGIDFNVAAIKSKGFAQFLQDIIQASGGSTESMAQLFGGVEALAPMLSIAADQGMGLNEILEDMANKAGATQEAFDKVSSSLSERYQRVLAQVRDLMRQLGEIILTILVPALEALLQAGPLLEASFKALIVVIAAMAASRIPLLVASVVSLVAQFTAAVSVTGALSAAMGVLRAAMLFLGGPLGLVLALLGGAAAAALLFRDNADLLKTSSYDAATGTAELNKALGVFYSTAAPSSAKAAAELANTNHKLATSAFEAAKAELAKRKSMLQLAKGAGLGGTSSIRDMGISVSDETRKHAAALKDLEQAERDLDQAQRDRVRTARVISSGDFAPVSVGIPDVDIPGLIPNIPDLPGGGGGAASKTSALADAVRDLTSEYRNQLDTMFMTNKELEEFEIRQKLVQAAQKDGIPLTEETVQGVLKLKNAYDEAANSAKAVTEGFKLGFADFTDSIQTNLEFARDLSQDFFKGLSSGLSDFIKTGKFDFKEFIRGLLAQIIDFMAQKMVMSFFQGFMGGGGAAGGGIGSFIGGLFGFASGGLVRGKGTGTSDSNLALLSNREYVINARSTKEHLGLLGLINQGASSMDLLKTIARNAGSGVTALATGGMVGGTMARAVQTAAVPVQTMPVMAGASQAARTAPVINMHINTPDAASFQRSEPQVSAMLNRMVQRGQRSL